MSASIQLWSVREAARESGWPDTIGRIADLGFASVEPFAIHLTAAELAAPIADAGLTVPTAHGFLGPDELSATLDAAGLLDCRTVFHPAFDARSWVDDASLDSTAQILRNAAEAAAGRGVAIGFHNHEVELLRFVGGQPAFWSLIDRLPNDVRVEYDVYWSAIARADSVHDLGRLGARTAALHLKDGPIGGSATDQVALGEGVLPLNEILASASRAQPVLSLDRFAGSVPDIWRAVERSRDWLAESGVL